MKDLLGVSLLFIPRLLTGGFSKGREILKYAPSSFQMKVIGPWAKETPFVRMATLDSSNLIYLSEDVLPFEWDEVVSLEKSKCLLGAFDPYWNFVVHAKSGSKRVRLTVDDPTKMLAWFAKSE